MTRVKPAGTTIAGKPLTGLRFTAKLPPPLRKVSRAALRLGSPGTRSRLGTLVPALSTRGSRRAIDTAATQLRFPRGDGSRGLAYTRASRRVSALAAAGV